MPETKGDFEFTSEGLSEVSEQFHLQTIIFGLPSEVPDKIQSGEIIFDFLREHPESTQRQNMILNLYLEDPNIILESKSDFGLTQERPRELPEEIQKAKQ